MSGIPSGVLVSFVGYTGVLGFLVETGVAANILGMVLGISRGIILCLR